MDPTHGHPDALLHPSKPPWGFAEVLRLSWPAILTMLNGTVMRFIDGLMLSSLSHLHLSGQFMGGMTAFVFESFAMGVLMVVNTYVSQNYGAKRFSQCPRYVWAGLLMALTFAVMVSPLIFVARPIFDLLISAKSEAIRPYATTYFQYMVAGIAINQCGVVFQRFFYGIHRPTVVFFVSLLANGVNILLNYVLIFGKFGFPALGLHGAAIGTLTGFLLMFVILGGWFLHPRLHAKYQTRRIRIRWEDCKSMLRIGWPAGVQFTNDLVTWSIMTSVLVAGFGTAHAAASIIGVRYMSLSFMPAVGIGIATTSLVGKYIGEGRHDIARKRAHAAFLLAMTYMVTCAIVFFFFRHDLVGFFARARETGDLPPAEAATLAADIVRFGGRIIVCACVFQLFDALGIVFIGALRGAGDTFWPMGVTMALSWTLVLGGGYLATQALPDLTSLGPWLAASVYVITLGIVMAWRFESGAWRKLDLLGQRSAGEF